MSPRVTRARLSVLTFLLFFGFGATGPVMSLYLQGRLGFSGTETGLILSVSALSALVSPFVSAVVADRLISAERLFGVLLLAGGALMGALHRTQAFWAFLTLYLLHYLAVGATASLANAIVFHKIEDRREYGSIRVWGTVGWIAVAWVFGWLWLRGPDGAPIPERLPDALLLSALSMVGLGIYAFTLPPSVGANRSVKTELLPRTAFEVLRRPAVAWLALATAAAAVTDRIYYYGAAIYLVQIGVGEPDVLPVLSLGQVPEIFAMLLLGRLTRRLGLAPVLLLGTLCNVLRYLCFVFGRQSPAAAIVGILMHGLTYAFFFSTVYILLDGMTHRESRSGVHQLFGLVTTGLGGLLGSWLAGVVMDACRLPDGSVGFGLFWSIPLGISIGATAAAYRGLGRGDPNPPAVEGRV